MNKEQLEKTIKQLGLDAYTLLLRQAQLQQQLILLNRK